MNTSKITKVSVIVPVHNEAATAGILLEQLCNKRIPGVEFEIIVMHSHSTDGTTEIVNRFRNRAIICTQARAMGKGHAVRHGLIKATGDIIMIQDADLEYSLDDYEELLNPILNNDGVFVLGSRHSIYRPMRSFTSSPIKAWVMNVGHWFFTLCINKLFHAELNDPFTMFKVFRRACIAGMNFKCNRFDFDFELVIKLLKRGYHPVEVPVSYKSRRFQQGKKVRLWRDPPTWIYTMLRLLIEP